MIILETTASILKLGTIIFLISYFIYTFYIFLLKTYEPIADTIHNIILIGNTDIIHVISLNINGREPNTKPIIA